MVLYQKKKRVKPFWTQTEKLFYTGLLDPLTANQ